jgi:hypothetical protein
LIGKAESKKESKLKDDKNESNIVFAPKQNIALNYDDIDKVYVKVLSIVLADMPPVRSHELNSPLVTVSCGPWEKKTNIDYGAGASTKWTKLYWKIILGRFDILSFNVSSHSSGCDSIGNIGVAIDDLLPDKVGSDGVVIIVRYLTDGKNITGKIRVRLQIRYPTAIATILNNAASHAADIQRRNSQLHLAEMSNAAAAAAENRRLSIEKNGSGRVVVTSFPFKLTITSITAVDLKPRHTLFANSPYVNAVYGPWGQGTEVMSGAGACACWQNLDWSMSIDEEHHLELNVWSRGVAIGGISLSPKYLLSQSIDKFGQTTLLLKLTDEYHVTSGKLKITCIYNQDVSEFAMVTEAQKQKAIDEMVRLGLYFTNHNTSIELPATAKVVGVSVIDLASVHFTKPNSPRVKLACDRQIAATTIAVRGGAHAQWIGMEWKFDIHKGSFLILAVTSEEKLIGSLELSAKAIVSIPANSKNVVEITAPITSTSGSITGRIKLSLKLSALGTHSAPMVAGRVPISPHADPKHFFENENHTSLASLTQNKLLLVVSMEKIQLHDLHLRSNLIHQHKGLWISLSYGKYHEATAELPVIPISAGPKEVGMFWSDLDWKFKVKEDYSLRMLLHSADGILLGSLSISPQTLFSNQNQTSTGPDAMNTLTETFFDENHGIAKVSFSYKKIVLKDWCNDFKAIEHGPNGYKAANRAAMMGTLASTGSTVSAIAANGGLLPPIFEGNGLGSIEEEEDDGEGGLLEDDDDMEFPMVAHLNNILIVDFNDRAIQALIKQQQHPSSSKPPLRQPQQSSMNEWFTRNIFGIASQPHKDDHLSVHAGNLLKALPKGTRVCVRIEIHGDQHSNGGARGSRWSYETDHISCDEAGKLVRIEDDVKIPLLSMHTEVNLTVFIRFPPNEHQLNQPLLTHVLGTAVILAEDFADIPRDEAYLTSISRSVSKGGAASARLNMTCRLRPTSLQTLYQQHFQSSRPNTTQLVQLPVIPPPAIKVAAAAPSAPESDPEDLDHAPANAWIDNPKKTLVPLQQSSSITNLMTQALSPTSRACVDSAPRERAGSGGGMINGKPYQFDIATDENAIGRLFGNRSPPQPAAAAKPSRSAAVDDIDDDMSLASETNILTSNSNVFKKKDPIVLKKSLVTKTVKSKPIAKRNMMEEDFDDEEALESPSGLISVTAFKDETPEVNYAEEARRRRFSDLISGVTTDDEADDGDLDEQYSDEEEESESAASPMRTSTNQQRSRAPSIHQALKSYQMNDDVLFEKIKLTGYHITIKNIMLLDLIAAHRFKSNSPAIAVTCGKDIFTTKILEDAGSTGSWHNLNFAGIIHRDNDITFTISSRGVIFAAITFTLKQLLRAASTGKITDTTASGSSPFKTRKSIDLHDSDEIHDVKFDKNNESGLVTVSDTVSG